MILSLAACGKDNDSDSSAHNHETRPTVDTTASHDDGYYEISITIEDRTDLFVVDAYFGYIEIMADDTESQPEPEEEGPYDFYIEGTDPEFNAGLEPEIPEMLD